MINGTFDWVYEEELGLRKGFRWSPDSKSIAYWQIDDAGVRDMVMVDNLSGLYPKLTTFAYPKVGQQNPICRVGVHQLESGKVRWIDTGADQRDHYLARMDWARRSDQLLIQRFNRKQNTNQVMLADAKTGRTQVSFVERDDAWVNANKELFWIGSKQFTWISERWLATRLPRSTGRQGLKQITVGNSMSSGCCTRPSATSCSSTIPRPVTSIRGLDGKGLKRITPSDAGRDGRLLHRAREAPRSVIRPSIRRRSSGLSACRIQGRLHAREQRPLRKKPKAIEWSPTEFSYIDIGKGTPMHFARRASGF